MFLECAGTTSAKLVAQTENPAHKVDMLNGTPGYVSYLQGSDYYRLRCTRRNSPCLAKIVLSGEDLTPIAVYHQDPLQAEHLITSRHHIIAKSMATILGDVYKVKSMAMSINPRL